jgi:hypothetical protein
MKPKTGRGGGLSVLQVAAIKAPTQILSDLYYKEKGV